jgi:hypothetical protein
MITADSFKTNQHSFELVFPSEGTFNCLKSFFINALMIDSLATAFGAFSIPFILFDIWDHPTIENIFAIGDAVIASIEAHNAAF